MRQLLLGCGRDKEKKVFPNDNARFDDLVTLDIDKSCNPDVVHDLNILPLPFDDDEFNEIHMYEVLEHLGTQGDYKRFFAEFAEYWRILKPFGLFCGSVPRHDNIWAFGDPGHTRVLPFPIFLYLDQDFYDQENNEAATDYRKVWQKDFKLIWKKETSIKNFFILQKRGGESGDLPTS